MSDLTGNNAKDLKFFKEEHLKLRAAANLATRLILDNLHNSNVGSDSVVKNAEHCYSFTDEAMNVIKDTVKKVNETYLTTLSELSGMTVSEVSVMETVHSADKIRTIWESDGATLPDGELPLENMHWVPCVVLSIIESKEVFADEQVQELYKNYLIAKDKNSDTPEILRELFLNNVSADRFENEEKKSVLVERMFLNPLTDAEGKLYLPHELGISNNLLDLQKLRAEITDEYEELQKRADALADKYADSFCNKTFTMELSNKLQ